MQIFGNSKTANGKPCPKYIMQQSTSLWSTRWGFSVLIFSILINSNSTFLTIMGQFWEKWNYLIFFELFADNLYCRILRMILKFCHLKMWYFRVQKDELCNEVLNMNAKHECLIPLHKESWVKNEQRVM